MLRRSLVLSLLGLTFAAVLISAGCSGPDAPPKKTGGSGTGTGSDKSLTTAAP